MRISLAGSSAALSFVLMAAFAAPCSAAIDIDLSYVNQSSEQFQRFKNYVDNAVDGDPDYGFSATDAAYMYKLTGQAQYANLAVSMVEDQVSQAEAAIASGQTPEVAGDSYLDAGGMISDLALTYDWCSSFVTSSQRTRWASYAGQTIFNVWNPAQARWGETMQPWSGWSINNPGNNYYYSFMEATMYWTLASDDATWMSFLNTNKIPLLESYFADLDGGGSREGTGYGLSHRTLFGLYRAWRDAAGNDIGNANSHMTDSILWWIHATVPTMDYVAPIGDQSRVSVPAIYDYHRHLMLEARQTTTDATAQSNASWWLHHISIGEMTSGFNFRHDLLPAGSASAAPPTDLVYYGSGTGQLFARTGWDTGAMWLQFSAGPYVESHAHQDQGSFTLYENDWLAVTENIWSHSGIQQGTETNNMLRFEHNGSIVEQQVGTTSTMTYTPGAGGSVHAVANLTPAYDGNSAVGSWQRTIDFASRMLTVHDNYTTGSGTQAIFQVNVPVHPTISGQTVTAGNLKIQVVSPANATITAVDWTGEDSDYNSGWRVDISGGSGEYIVQLSSDYEAPEEVFSNGFD